MISSSMSRVRTCIIVSCARDVNVIRIRRRKRSCMISQQTARG